MNLSQRTTQWVLRLRLRLADLIRSTELQALLFWAGVIGLIGGLASILFRRGVEIWQYLLMERTGSVVEIAQSLDWWHRLLIPTVGGLVAGAVLHFGLHLTRRIPYNDYMEAIVLGEGRIRSRSTLVKCASSLCSIGSGASIGREGPMVQISSMLASLLGRFLKVSPPRLRLLSACGAAAGIASAYNAPIAGALFVAEIVLGSISMESFGPLIFASVVATLTVQTFYSSAPIFQVPTFKVVSGYEFFFFIGLGILAGTIAPVLLRLLDGAKKQFEKLTIPIWLKLTAGGLAVGAISIGSPDVWGNGYSVVSSILQTDWLWQPLAILLLCKLAATVICFGSGAVGGVFTPTLFMGAALGCLVGIPLHILLPDSTASPGAYALVGMGAFLAATTHAPLMAILMLFEMTLDYAIVLPLMLTCVTAYYTAWSFSKESVYSAALRANREERHRFSLVETRVRELLKPNPRVVKPNASFTEVCRAFLSEQNNNLYVIDDDRRFLGVIPLQGIKPHINNRDLAGLVIAQDLIDEGFLVTTADSSLAHALELFSQQPCERLPVVDDLVRRTLIGTISKTDLLLAFADASNGGETGAKRPDVAI